MNDAGEVSGGSGVNALPPRHSRLVGTLLDEYHKGFRQDAVMSHRVRAVLGRQHGVLAEPDHDVVDVPGA